VCFGFPVGWVDTVVVLVVLEVVVVAADWVVVVGAVVVVVATVVVVVVELVVVVEEVAVVSVVVSPSGPPGTAARAVATPRMATNTALRKNHAARPILTVWWSSYL
jgi:hypothetical protein